MDIFDTVARKITTDLDKASELAVNLRLNLLDLQDTDDNPVNRHKVTVRGAAIIKKAVAELPVIGDAPADVKNAIEDYQEEMVEQADEAREDIDNDSETDEELELDDVEKDELNDDEDEIIEDEDDVDESDEDNKDKIVAIKRADQSTEALLLIADLIGKGYSYEEAKEMAMDQINNARAYRLAKSKGRAMKKGQRVIYDTTHVVGKIINGKKVRVGQRVLATIAGGEKGVVELVTDSGWSIETPIVATVAGRKFRIVSEADDKDDTFNFAKDDDKKKDDVPDKEAAVDEEDDDEIEDKEAKAVDTEDKPDDEEDKSKESVKRIAADIPEASQDGTLGAGNTDSIPDVGQEGGKLTGPHREKGRPDISQEKDSPPQVKVNPSHIDGDGDKQVSKGTDETLKNPKMGKGRRKLSNVSLQEALDELDTIYNENNAELLSKAMADMLFDDGPLEMDWVPDDVLQEAGMAMKNGTIEEMGNALRSLRVYSKRSKRNAKRKVNLNAGKESSRRKVSVSEGDKVTLEMQDMGQEDDWIADEAGNLPERDEMMSLMSVTFDVTKISGGYAKIESGDKVYWVDSQYLNTKKSAKNTDSRSARLSKLKAMAAGRKGNKKQVEMKRTSTGRQLPQRLSRNALDKGLQTKISQVERDKAVLYKKNRRLEAEKLADVMIAKRLIIASQRDAEINTLAALNDEGWRQAKRIIEQSPDQEPRYDSRRVPASRQIQRAYKQASSGYGPRVIQASKPVATHGSGYLDNGTMFED